MRIFAFLDFGPVSEWCQLPTLRLPLPYSELRESWPPPAYIHNKLRHSWEGWREVRAPAPIRLQNSNLPIHSVRSIRASAASPSAWRGLEHERRGESLIYFLSHPRDPAFRPIEARKLRAGYPATLPPTSSLGWEKKRGAISPRSKTAISEHL